MTDEDCRERRDGRGSQSIYLTELPHPLALQLAELLGHEIAARARAELVSEPDLVKSAPQNAELVLWEEHLRQDIEADPALATTEKESLVLARRGQGLFKTTRAVDRNALPRHRRRPPRTP